jgi:putative flippase GtrA
MSIIFNFFINHLWTFKNKLAGKGWFPQAARFHVVSFVGGTLQWFTFVVMNMVWLLLTDTEAVSSYHAGTTTWMARWLWHPFVSPPKVGNWVYISHLLGISLAMFWDYLINFHWTWPERKENSNEK